MDQPRAPFSFYAATLTVILALISIEGTGCSSAASPSAPKESTENQGEKVARDISDVELIDLMAQRSDLLLIDVRTSQEWDAGHIEGACFLDFLEDDFKSRAEALPKDRPIALYCAAGGRSEDAMKLLAKAGLRSCTTYAMGFMAGKMRGAPFRMRTL